MESTNAAEYGPPGSGGWGPPGGGYGAPPTPPAPPGGGYGSPPAFGAPPPPVGFVPPPAAPLMPGAGGDVNTTLPLLLNVFALIMCGATLFSLPLSILGIVFALQAKKHESAGDLVSARAKASLSNKLFGGALLIGFLLLAIWQYLAPR